MKGHFIAMAAYSAWANRRLSSDASRLPEGLVHKDVGLYFKSLFGTLTHLLQSDLAWTFLLQGGSLGLMSLPAPPEHLEDYLVARENQDIAFEHWMETLDEAWFRRPFSFTSAMGSWQGMVYEGTNSSALTHVLNHQTHHRGQAHAALTVVGVPEPNALDILVKGMLKE